jgi:hypothetical protein
MHLQQVWTLMQQANDRFVDGRASGNVNLESAASLATAVDGAVVFPHQELLLS